MKSTHPFLFEFRYAQLKDNLPEFNEFDHSLPLKDETRARYNRERWEKLSQWHGNAPFGDGKVETQPFAYQNGDYTGSGIIYRPKDAEGTLPMAVFIHGGGWTTLAKECYAYECATFALQGNCVVFNIDYRLAPEAQFPTPMEDCYAALCAAAAQAQSYGADAKRIAVIGDSAGGNLCAVMALASRDRGGPKIALQVLCYPGTSFRQLERVMGAERNVPAYLASADDASNPYASPLEGDLAGLPPCLLIVGTMDFLFDDNRRYAAALREAGVELDMVVYEGMPHGFIQMVNEPALDSLACISAKLREKLHGQAPSRPAHPGLITYKYAEQMPNLPAFNEFGDKYDEMTSENIKAYWAERWALLSQWRGNAPIEGVTVEPFAFMNGDVPCEAQVYTPKGVQGKLPLVMYVHGGGATLCKELYAYECAEFARQTPAVVLNMDYHTAGRTLYPNAQEDCYAGLCAALAQANTLGIDPAHVAVVGDSAGGNICAAVTLMARDRGGPRISLQILLYPATDMGALAALRSGQPVDQALADNPYASPIAGDLAGLPKCLLIVGSVDFLFEDNLAYIRKLKDAGVDATLMIYQGMPHGFIQMVNEPAADARRTIRDALQTQLK